MRMYVSTQRAEEKIVLIIIHIILLLLPSPVTAA